MWRWRGILPRPPRFDNRSMPWDLFCRVVDNFGDVGVCWRLAADLAGRGVAVRLWVDDASALAWMAPGRAVTHPAVDVRPWDEAEAAPPGPGPVVIEAFGCDPPAAFVARMAALPRPPVWINLEYLSAEDHVERSHRLPSPQFGGPGAGLVKHFFFPGVTRATGGLLREPGLLDRQAGFDGEAWRAAHGWAARPGERTVSLFCYPSAPVGPLLERLDERPTLLLATAGAATSAVQAALGPPMRRGALRTVALPWLSQPDYDRLLWSCDLNAVRGEDSLVRAMWAGRPFLWQIYAQSDGAHAPKLDAMLARITGERRGPPDTAAAELAAWWRGWNQLAALPAEGPHDLAGWQRLALDWRTRLTAQDDLVSQLKGFVDEQAKIMGFARPAA